MSAAAVGIHGHDDDDEDDDDERRRKSEARDVLVYVCTSADNWRR